MTAIRSLLAQRQWAVLICAAALLLKLIVPTGYMVGAVDGRVAMMLCPGTQTMAVTPDAPMAMVGHAMAARHPVDHPPGHSDSGHGREMPCAFAGLAAPLLDSIDPIQLAALIAFVMAVGLAVRVLAHPVDAPRLRPPLRGPPALS